MSREPVRKWRVRFAGDRMGGLAGAPRPGALRKITGERGGVLVTRTLTQRGRGQGSHWPAGTMAAETGLSRSSVSRAWIWDLTVPGNNDHDFYVMAGELLGRISRSGYYCCFPLRADGGDLSDGHFSETGRRRLRHSWATSAWGTGDSLAGWRTEFGSTSMSGPLR